MKAHRYFVYIMASKSRRLYTGMAHDVVIRVREHKFGFMEGFTSKYRITRLVYYETFTYVNNCIAREKQIKAWTRAKRVALIESVNPTWEDLAADWFLPDGELNLKSRSLASLGMTNWRGAASVAALQAQGMAPSRPSGAAEAAPSQALKASGRRS